MKTLLSAFAATIALCAAAHAQADFPNKPVKIIIDSAPGNLNGEIPTPFKLQASLENVQEFRVESSSYPAEFGTGTGGQVSVITKSGGNAVHGAIFEYLRSDNLDKPNYFDSQRNVDGSVVSFLGKSPLKQNQFGGSMGGARALEWIVSHPDVQIGFSDAGAHLRNMAHYNFPLRMLKLVRDAELRGEIGRAHV